MPLIQCKDYRFYSLVLLLNIGFLSNGFSQSENKASRLPVEWKTIPIQDQSEYGSFAGVCDDYLVLAGGLRIELNSGDSIFTDKINIYELNGSKVHKRETDLKLPKPSAFGSTISLGKGLICVGGKNKQGLSKEVTRIYRDNRTNSYLVDPLPDLPLPLAIEAAYFHEEKVYVAGEFTSSEEPHNRSLKFYSLNLKGKDPDWEELLLPSRDIQITGLSFQSDGENDRLHLFTNSSDPSEAKAQVYKYDSPRQKWAKVKSLSCEFVKGGAVPLGTSHILAMYKAVSGSSKTSHFGVFHTITSTWVELGEIPFEGSNYLFSGDKSLFLMGQNGKDPINFAKGVPVSNSKGLSTLDQLVFVVYFLALLLLGYLFSKRLLTTNDYFRGGQRIPWWAAGISILATKLSAITFMSLPVKAYATNWSYFWIPVGNIILALIVVKYVIPFFCRLNVTSTYEYLEKRYNSTIRTIGSLLYVVFELVRMGVLILLPAIVITVVTGMDLFLCISLIGIVATVYTLLGGIEAVIWTDVIQVFIMVLGAIIAIFIVIQGMSMETAEAIGLAWKQGKFKSFDLNPDLARATTLVIVLSWSGKLQDYISNQSVVQRFISTKDEASAGKSMWIATLMGIPVFTLFLILGTALFIFYQFNPARLNPMTEQPDALLPNFITNEMPVGIVGLVIGAIFSAAMSSLDSGINSMSTVLVTDIYKRFFSASTDKKSLSVAKWFTAFLGLFGTMSALIMAGYNIKSLYDQLFSVIGLFGGGLAGIFVLGMFTKKGSSKGAIAGLLFSSVLLYYVSNHTSLHVFLYAVIGLSSCFAFGYLVSLILPDPERNLNGLTVHSLVKGK